MLRVLRLLLGLVAAVMVLDGCLASHPQPTLAAENTPTNNTTPAFKDGHADRFAYERWFAGLSGEFRNGADFWAAHRSDSTPPPTCSGPDHSKAFYDGCVNAKGRLDPTDARHKVEPQYKAGWNSPVDIPAPLAEGSSASVTPPDKNLNLRDGPSAGGDIRAVLTEGTKVKIIQSLDNGWKKVVVETIGDTGQAPPDELVRFVNGIYLSQVVAATPPLIAPPATTSGPAAATPNPSTPSYNPADQAILNRLLDNSKTSANPSQQSSAAASPGPSAAEVNSSGGQYNLRCDPIRTTQSPYPIMMYIDTGVPSIHWTQQDAAGNFFAKDNPNSQFVGKDTASGYDFPLLYNKNLHRDCIMKVHTFLIITDDDLEFGEHDESNSPCGNSQIYPDHYEFSNKTKDTDYKLNKTTGIAELWDGTYQCAIAQGKLIDK